MLKKQQLLPILCLFIYWKQLQHNFVPNMKKKTAQFVLCLFCQAKSWSYYFIQLINIHLDINNSKFLRQKCNSQYYRNCKMPSTKYLTTTRTRLCKFKYCRGKIIVGKLETNGSLPVESYFCRYLLPWFTWHQGIKDKQMNFILGR